MKQIKLTNRSDGIVTYSLPELNIRRVFNIQESKEVPEKELNALWQTDGGAQLIRHYLKVEDIDWVKKTFEVPVEYFWSIDEIKKCIIEDDLELFAETLDYAPRGVIDLIKQYSWRIPLNDLNKIQIIRDKLGFDVLAAIKIMAPPEDAQKPIEKQERRRRREE